MTLLEPLVVRVVDNPGAGLVLGQDAALVDVGGGRVNVLSAVLGIGASGPVVRQGAGSPEGVVTAIVGSLFLRTDGGAGTTLYVKESGAGSTGWVAK